MSTDLRICIINEFFWPDNTGGTGTVLSELVQALREQFPQIQIDVITSRNRYRSASEGDSALLPAQETWNGVRIQRVNCAVATGKKAVARLIANTQFMAGALLALMRRHRQKPYNMVLVGTAPPTLAVAAKLFRAVTGVPYLYVVYDLDPDRAIVMHVLSAKSPFAYVLRILQKQWLHSAGCVVVLGRCMREYLTRTYALPAHKIAVIPPGSDPNEIVPSVRENSDFRRKHGLSDNFVVCYSGNFGRYHNFDTMLDAAKDLQIELPQVRFVLVGGGAQNNHIRDRVANEKIDNVLVLPFVAREEYPDLLAAANVSLVTLEPGMEGLCVPSKFYSILASGRPVIASMSSVSEVARVLEEENCGIRVDTTDSSGLQNAIRRLVEDPKLGVRMGQNARMALERRFSTACVADAYWDAIQQVIFNSSAKTEGDPVEERDKTPVAS